MLSDEIVVRICWCLKYGYICDKLFFFFFKQKTAYEIMPSLVGSEMCIRDRVNISPAVLPDRNGLQDLKPSAQTTQRKLSGNG